MATITVRAREPHDFEAVAAIMGCPGVTADTLQLPFRSLEVRREQFTPQLAGMHDLVAEIEGHVVGQSHLAVAANPRRRHSGGIGLSVHDDFQERGVGSALMAAMLDLADNWLDLRRIELEVYRDNAPAIRLYEKFGFAIEGTLRAYAYRNGAYVDAYAMARLRGLEHAG